MGYTRREFSEDEIKTIINEYIKGSGLTTLSKLLKTNERSVRNILVENNIEIRGKGIQVNKENYSTTKKYTFNEDFFEIIDTEEKAYWLGFLYADGNVSIHKSKKMKTKGATVEVSLKQEDDYHLYNFVENINGNIPIKYRDIKLNNKIYKACRVMIHSIKMAKDLVKNGCFEAKSLILKFPQCVPNFLLNHFIRGYIDGDGCVAFNTYEYGDSFAVSLLGTYDFLKEVKNAFETIGIKVSQVKQEKSKAFSVIICGHDNLVKLYNYLYNDSTIFLGRKLDKFRDALIYFNKEFNISDVAKLYVLFDENLQDKIFNRNVIRPQKDKHAQIASLLD